MAYPDNIDQFTEKLNKKDSSVYVIEEIVQVTGGKYEGILIHDNINPKTIKVYSGPKLTGEEIENVIVSVPSDTPWKKAIKVFTDTSPVYISYETTGDQVEAEDINRLQDSMTFTQTEIDRYKAANDSTVTGINDRLTTVENNKAEKVYTDTELNKKADKVNTYTKTETDQRIQLVIDAAPEALNTLKEIANALNNDPDFAATMTTQLSTKVDKVTGKGLSTEDYTTSHKNKLVGIEDNANNYIHPSNHAASIITEDTTHRFASDTEKTTWNNKETPAGAQVKANQAKADANTYTDQHANDDVKHITAEERTNWNSVNDKVDKVIGKGLSEENYTSVEKTKLSGIANNANNYTHPSTHSMDLITETTTKKVMTSSERSKLAGIVDNANNYSHPSTHSASIITQDSTHRFVTDSEKTLWNAKAEGSHTHASLYEPKNINIQSHIASAHAPADAQKNSDITKSEIEGKLIGILSSHSHNPDHTHSNKSVLDKVSASGSEPSFDLSKLVTVDELGSAGYGDMLKATYDTDGDGKVDTAEQADSVPWSGISGKPTAFTPSVHGHNIQDLAYKQISFYVEGDANTYYPVVIDNISDYQENGQPSRKYIEIFRAYNWTAPSTWYTSTHKGSLQLYIDTYAYGWGGQNYYLELKMAQQYSKIMADIRIPEPDTDLIIVWLRGGHANYKLLAYDKNITLTPFIGNFVHRQGTQYERTFTPRTDVETAFNFVGGDFRKFSTIDYQYIGGSYRDPKNGYQIWHAGNFDPSTKMSTGPVVWNDLKGV